MMALAAVGQMYDGAVVVLIVTFHKRCQQAKEKTVAINEIPLDMKIEG